jgi:hypothetical protein
MIVRGLPYGDGDPTVSVDDRGWWMVGLILAQLRGRPWRALALVAGVFAATTGFTVLSGSVDTSQVRATGTVAANYRAAYDVLVRPKGARTKLETQRNLVQPNYLSGLFGGITMGQLAQVRAIPGVEVAAPIATLGYAYATIHQGVDLTDVLDPTARDQVFRLSPSWIADRGLTVIDDAPHYVYVSRNRLYQERVIVGLQPPGPVYTDGTALPHSPFVNCYYTVLEIDPSGVKTPLCVTGVTVGSDGTTRTERTAIHFWEVEGAGRYADAFGLPRTTVNRLVVQIDWRVMVGVAAIDPPAEAGLVGLDRAVVSGRYLRPDELPTVQDPGGHVPGYDFRYLGVPALVANQSYVDEQVEVGVQRLDSSAPPALVGRDFADWVPALAALPGTTTGPPTHSIGQPELGATGADLAQLYQSGPPSYTVDAAGELHPQPVTLTPHQWRVALDGGGEGNARPPVFAFDLGFRSFPQPRGPALEAPRHPRSFSVGVFDPQRLRDFSPLSRVPLESYRPPDAPGGDARSRQLLGDQPLLPASSPIGYLAPPALVLINLASLDRIPRPYAQQQAPLNAIRARVRGVTGMDSISQERVRLVAADIAAATGLDVDITIGSSQAPQTVQLPAGHYGRPALTLSEFWSKKGVAVAIVRAADRKSLVLLGLVLLVCVMFLANAVAAAVRDRRRELGILACLGWPARRLAGAILGEVALVGLAAGVAATVAAVPLSRAAGVSIAPVRALLAIPIGVGLALLAAATPAVSAARSTPAESLAPAVRPPRRARRQHTVLGLAMTNLVRVPGRTMLGALALAVGVCGVLMMLVVLLRFRNDLVGTLLGTAVAVRIRSVDVLAAGLTILLGLTAVADVLYVNIRERAVELATLVASGWTDARLTWLVAGEGLGMGAIGSLIGAGAGCLGIALFVGRVGADVVLLALAVVALATALTGIIAVLPALFSRRLPLAAALAEE